MTYPIKFYNSLRKLTKILKIPQKRNPKKAELLALLENHCIEIDAVSLPNNIVNDGGLSEESEDKFLDKSKEVWPCLKCEYGPGEDGGTVPEDFIQAFKHSELKKIKPDGFFDKTFEYVNEITIPTQILIKILGDIRDDLIKYEHTSSPNDITITIGTLFAYLAYHPLTDVYISDDFKKYLGIFNIQPEKRVKDKERKVEVSE